MFDTAPVPLEERLATDVARISSHGDWIDVVAAAIEDGRLDPGSLLREDYELVSDIPSLDLLAFGSRPTDLARVVDQFRDGRDEVGRAAFRILRRASEGALDDEAAPYVGAAVVNVLGHDQAQQHLLESGQQRYWRHWAELVPDSWAGSSPDVRRCHRRRGLMGTGPMCTGACLGFECVFE